MSSPTLYDLRETTTAYAKGALLGRFTNWTHACDHLETLGYKLTQFEEDFDHPNHFDVAAVRHGHLDIFTITPSTLR